MAKNNKKQDPERSPLNTSSPPVTTVPSPDPHQEIPAEVFISELLPQMTSTISAFLEIISKNEHDNDVEHAAFTLISNRIPWFPNYLSTSLEALESNPSIDTVPPPAVVFSENIIRSLATLNGSFSFPTSSPFASVCSSLSSHVKAYHERFPLPFVPFSTKLIFTK